jgi:hypothetical protein
MDAERESGQISDSFTPLAIQTTIQMVGSSMIDLSVRNFTASLQATVREMGIDH